MGKAHGLLAQLCLDHHQTERAERHIDRSVACGIPVPYDYRTVGEQQEEVGRSADARRAYRKAMMEGDVLAKPGRTVGGNTQVAFEDLF